MKKVALFNNRPVRLEQVYGEGRKERLAEIADLYPHTVTDENFSEHAPYLRDVEAVFSTWGMLKIEDDRLDQLPDLKMVFYAAGSVQGFAPPLLKRGVRVVSAWYANAVPVAEYTLGQILLANKGYFRNIRDCATSEGRRNHPFIGRGNFGATVAVLGVGAVGRALLRLLKPFHLSIIVFDPFLSNEDAHSLGVSKVSLEQAFRAGDIITNHLANKPQTRHMLKAPLFAMMKDEATFINTGRGATANEADLVAEFTRRPTLTALLDVTYPEPPDPESPLYTMPNVFLTSHIAGAVNDEVIRLADAMIEDFTAWEAGSHPQGEVTLDMLERLG